MKSGQDETGEQVRGAATRKEVARLAAVSPPTVSLVLNNNPGTRISDATRKRVLEAAVQLGYQPSALASALATGKTRTIGVVMHYAVHPFTGYSSDILDGAWERAIGAGYRLLVTQGSHTQSVAGLFRERCVDGILVLAVPRGANDPELRELSRKHFPMVFVGSRPDGIETDYVDIDNETAGRTATEALLRAGHRQILHVTGPTDVNSSAVERQRGYEQAIRAAGLPLEPDMVLFGSYSHDIARTAMTRFLNAPHRPFTAVFAASYSMALGIRMALNAHGLRVPEDVSMTTIDRAAADASLASTVEFYRLSQPSHGIGLKAIEVLFERLQSRTAIEPRKLFMPFEVIPGNSVTPPKG